jgi:hypothetical protein
MNGYAVGYTVVPMIANHTVINRTEALKFLDCIDSRTDRFTFQTFDDNKDRKDGRLAHTFHGTLDEHFQTLVNLNLRGAGVFVTVNSTNFQERTTECIDEVRCYFADLDNVPLDNIKRLARQPHITVETSPGKYQAFFNIEDAPLGQTSGGSRSSISPARMRPSPLSTRMG